jgi:hypothetical protein
MLKRKNPLRQESLLLFTSHRVILSETKQLTALFIQRIQKNKPAYTQKKLCISTAFKGVIKINVVFISGGIQNAA